MSYLVGYSIAFLLSVLFTIGAYWLNGPYWLNWVAVGLTFGFLLRAIWDRLEGE